MKKQITNLHVESISLFDETHTMKNKKWKYIFYIFLAILVPVICYLISKNINSFKQPISFVPDSTRLDMSNTHLAITNAILVIMGLYFYITRRDIGVLVLIPFLIFAVTHFSNSLGHYFNQIDSSQYEDIHIILNENPQLIPLIPNYVNSDCEMTLSNYDKIIALSHNLNAISSLSALKQMKYENVRKMCALTIYRNQ